MSRKIPDALVAHASELIKNGSKLKDAALAIGCNPDELSKKLRGSGIKIDGRRDWIALLPTIINLYRDGMSTVAIAEKFGAPRHSAANVRNLLIKAGVIVRSRNIAAIARFSAAPLEERKKIISKARQVRRRNMMIAAEKLQASHGIGFGERQIAEILEKAGLAVKRQVVVDDNYLIDLTVDHIAIEVKTSAIAAQINAINSARFKKLRECGFSIIFVVVNHLPQIALHADDLITAIKLAQRDPPSSGQYWVIRCTLEQIGTDIDVDHFSIERRSPKLGRARF